MSDDPDAAKIEAAKAALQNYMQSEFARLWEKVGAHAMIGGAVRTFWNEETGEVDMEAIDPADMWPEIGFVTQKQADLATAKMLNEVNPFVPFVLDAALKAKSE